ncbi:MAG: TAT-variant-translocated molybdopterin oxidoreductase [Vicinamibacterales bacterium]|jgi:molybdopterin-containing oxidoreductase family iron-sulfur binding subunit|nr:TAT-variant-translocated molybdopterin oxidoreductase [Vicinamibacterales bacterium]
MAKTYWMSLVERDQLRAGTATPTDEFAGRTPFDEAPSGPPASRRDFLRAAGFSIAAAGLAGCGRAPVERAIPYLVQPEATTPGRALYYASGCHACSAGCGALVKTREGRPIKLEGNPDHPLSRGGLCAAGQASLLGLYDSERLTQPLAAGTPTDWGALDRELNARLDDLAADGRAIRLLTGTITSPTVKATIDALLARFDDARHVVYDAISSSAILDAHLRTHGVRRLPRYHFDRADVVVGIDANFLGTWISPVTFTRDYQRGRSLAGDPPRLGYHAQFESIMTLTGSNADARVAVSPDDVPAVIGQLARRVADRAGASVNLGRLPDPPIDAARLDALADRLWAARRRSLVVSGSQSVDAQTQCNLINDLLGGYGWSLDITRPSFQRQGDDAALGELLAELDRGDIGALFVAGANPAYDLPDHDAFREAMAGVPLVVSFADRLDETAELATYVCPDHHALESWGDAEPIDGLLTVTQPTIHPVGGTRALVESLAAWAGTPGTALELMQRHWSEQIFPRASGTATFTEFWDRAVHDGFAEVQPTASTPGEFELTGVGPVAPPGSSAETLSLALYPTTGMHDGRHAHNAWLHELPDPVTKAVWDNYASLSPAAAAALGVREGDVLSIEPSGDGPEALELPTHLQPGQHDSVVAVALGYGRKGTDRFTNVGPRWFEGSPTTGPNGLVGVNAAGWIARTPNAQVYTRSGVRVAPTGARRALATTQEHHSINVPAHLVADGHARRPLVQETTLPAYVADPAAGGHAEHHEADLWPEDHATGGHRWGMVIDLNACTGCSACVVSCQAENNIPVVGRDEVQRQREMHWMRIDRYYADGEDGVDVVHQPMLCQHCDYAPCETVCPVLATMHSEEGLNQQIYNRCVGTRYCANNCPYKVRRFNWFDYPHEDRLQNLALNPDVVVRSRGVMEKCSLCVQRIQEGKVEAARRGERVEDGAVQTACQQSCPAQAITFGDLNDPTSAVARAAADPRRFDVLGELNVKPSIGYLTIVRNRPAAASDTEGDHA